MSDMRKASAWEHSTPDYFGLEPPLPVDGTYVTCIRTDGW